MGNVLLVTRVEAARCLSLSVRQLDRLIKREEIPKVMVGGSVRIPVAALEEMARVPQQQWEYLVRLFPVQDIGYSTFDKELCEWGQDGWEVVATTIDSIDFTVVFKRPLRATKPEAEEDETDE